MKTIFSLFLLLGMLTNSIIQAQSGDEFILPRTNPKATVSQQIASTVLEITYNRPALKGRTIFGQLVPYDQVWRTGSDAATRISISTPVWWEGKPIDAGTYELFTIPGKDYWTVILQLAKQQWGSYAYNPENDVLRVQVEPQKLPSKVESFTISVDNIKTNSAVLNISWDQVRVPVNLTIDLEATVIPELEAAIRADGKRPYFLAAMFYYENNLDIERAAELMTLAVEENPKHLGMLYRYALILEYKGDLEGARTASKRSLAETESAPPELKEEYVRLNTALLERLGK